MGEIQRAIKPEGYKLSFINPDKYLNATHSHFTYAKPNHQRGKKV